MNTYEFLNTEVGGTLIVIFSVGLFMIFGAIAFYKIERLYFKCDCNRKETNALNE